MTTEPSSLFEFRVERDRDIVRHGDLARIKYRRRGERRWSKFVVVLDDKTTLEMVEGNAERVILAYEGSQGRVHA